MILRLLEQNKFPQSIRGVGASGEEKLFRIEVTTYPEPECLNKVSKFRWSKQTYLVPFEKLSQQYKRIHSLGGQINNITSVN